jgi:5-methylcytosine-specific restriction endonuclease McrA
MLQKQNLIRLKGQALQKLHIEVYNLDNGKCCLQSEHEDEQYIEYGTLAHHVNHGKDKEDVKENMLMLCNKCHSRAHFKDVREIKRLCKEYLRQRDGVNKWNS